jgi:hypothetical protein
MNTESVIQELVTQCQPIEPLKPPAIRFSQWAISALVLIFVGVTILRPPNEIWARVNDPSFVVTALAMLSLALISTFSAFVLTIPDDRNRRFDLFPMGTVIVSFMLVGYLLLTSNVADSHPSYICVLRIIGLSVLPAALLFQMLRRAAPLRPGLTGLLAVLGSLSFSEIGVQFLCLNSLGSHVLVWHLLPIGLIALAGFSLGKLVLGR